MVRIAMFSGGKDGLRAAQIEWPVDAFLFLIYEFPEPSPHIVNLQTTIASASAIGVPIVVKRLHKGKEFIETVELLRKLNTDTLIAGDVFVEDHLKYMENLVREAGAKLREPLWSLDTLEILMKDIEDNYSFKVLGARPKNLRESVGKIINKDNINWFLELAKKDNADPLGEKGEYHTIVLKSPLHKEEFSVKDLEIKELDCCRILLTSSYFNQKIF
ncbi:PP-loop superfamily ATP-utilizing enzyme [Caldisphaera lagunensis DSM 15908]|uniref:PP-loop superfamily ATP-utilizing enzyme n=1 Tax=Caldisphaera lagunensis (strain DSM 15908 / JCM 11604 / ANMR 0165 / IC-154) TaxID=1056495 RepID=L0AC39_CALLD|nr:PP-loop superfamily ATP-utilizing enzyme [Caldisphaera lagunensis]AFZ70692.1 PP-loop superfamily ATP-utilizing enzyme [Caldisphaera lagunensis DSM 15908]